MLSLSQVKSGYKLRLLGYGHTTAAYRQRLLMMGLIPGAITTVCHIAPLGCPVQLDVYGSAISLRKDEAKELVWELV